jgi:hypothetical protein
MTWLLEPLPNGKGLSTVQTGQYGHEALQVSMLLPAWLIHCVFLQRRVTR